MTVHLNLSSRLWTLQLLGFEVRLQKKSHFNRFYKDTQRHDFRPLEDKHFCCLSEFSTFTWSSQIREELSR
jgi:hypothetical protein